MNRLIRILYSITLVCAVAGAGLVLCGFITIPVLGFTAGTVAAVGLWDLALGMLSGCLLLIAAMINRAMKGHWDFGRQGGFPARLLVMVSFVSVVLIGIMFVLDW
jgi:hypothetical protein